MADSSRDSSSPLWPWLLVPVAVGVGLYIFLPRKHTFFRLTWISPTNDTYQKVFDSEAEAKTYVEGLFGSGEASKASIAYFENDELIWVHSISGEIQADKQVQIVYQNIPVPAAVTTPSPTPVAPSEPPHQPVSAPTPVAPPPPSAPVAPAPWTPVVPSLPAGVDPQSFYLQVGVSNFLPHIKERLAEGSDFFTVKREAYDQMMGAGMPMAYAASTVADLMNMVGAPRSRI